jgi:hypothetical protein
MTPLDIYKQYRIYQGLQLHQLRVAAVARFVAQRSRGGADVELVTRVGLFHDMGNIIKADLVKFQEFLEPEGLAYWQGVQREYVDAYGLDEHVATDAICREIGLDEEVTRIVDAMRFSRTRWIVEEGSLTYRVAKYADLRVGPFGVLPMKERLAEARARYAGRAMEKGESYTLDTLLEAETWCGFLEDNLVSEIGFNPAAISSESTAALVEELKKYPLA